ncbi:hypothetical protein L1049_020234 [Liquidambar formosana]|uniref:Myosin XI n=1 Tax=Liquidambar formosana TaxID=63359 RepID=A0AAP0XAL5_LIQFO
MEQEKYTKEEIDWSNIDFVDNQDVLDLIENKPGGIIALLDEACMFPRSTHETFSYKLRQKFKNHKRFRKPKLPHTDFTICHYAGDVTYQTELFLDKNKDYFFPEHHALLNASKCSLVSGLFPALSDESSKTSKFSSIGSRFKQQLHDLLETLCAIEPHYIRCIKPNYLLKPGIFESKYVLHQLQCGGVMEAIRISCAGYPTRKQFYEFVAWFGILAPEVLSGSFDEVTACKKVLEKVGLKGYQIGKTKVFLRAGLMAELDARRSEVLGRLVSIIQRRIRSYLAHRNFILLRLSAIHIQAACKGQLDRKVYASMRREASCLRIQRELQMYVARKAYKELCSSAVSIQTAVRGMIACSEHRFRRQRRAAIIIQAEMEEAKTQENEKLQFAFQETQLQFKESKETLMKEHDVAKQAAEQILIVDDVPVIDYAMLEKLMSENEELKVLVSSLEQKIDETEKKYEETNKISEERLKQALEAESKIIQLKTAMQRLLPEIFFDLESENPILWKQALLNSPLKRISEHASTLASQVIFCRNNMHPLFVCFFSFLSLLQENVDALIRCVMKNIGFSNGKPVAAFTIYKCLLHWKSFEAERTSVFEHLIRMIGSAIENQDSNDYLAYWLSNTSVLLFFLQQSLKAAGVTNATRHKKTSPPTSLFGRISMGFLSLPSSSLAAARLDVVRQVEAKYPALLFKLQFTAYVEKIYGTIRDNLKKELASLLFLRIQAPRTSKGRLVRSGHSFGKCSASSHWQSIIGCLNALLSTLKENFVPPILVQKIFTQVFSFINVQLFNSLLLRRECCTFSNGEYVKAGLADLELWCCQAKEEYADSSWDELKHIRQAVGFLVKRQKYKISYAEITNDLCPILSIQQLYRICSLYRDDINNTRSLPPDVISSMRALIIGDSNNAVNSWFLLDDTSSIPFSVDDLSNSLQEKDFLDVKPAEELLNNPAFQFLH